MKNISQELDHTIELISKNPELFQISKKNMTSSAYGKTGNEHNHFRTSYGVVPTLYYSTIKNFDIRFFLAYIDQFYDYTNYTEQQLDSADYNRNEVRVGHHRSLLLLQSNYQTIFQLMEFFSFSASLFR